VFWKDLRILLSWIMRASLCAALLGFQGVAGIALAGELVVLHHGHDVVATLLEVSDAARQSHHAEVHQGRALRWSAGGCSRYVPANVRSGNIFLGTNRCEGRFACGVPLSSAACG